MPAGSGAIPSAVAAPLPASAPYAANLRCREGCALTPFTASPHQRVQCDRCGQRIAAGRQTLSCLAHDYDVCETCAAAPPAPQIVQGRVLPSPPQGVVQGTIVHRASGRGIVGERAVAGPTGVDGGMVLVECRFGDAAAVEMMVDSGAQHSVISAPLAQRLGLMNRLDRSEPVWKSTSELGYVNLHAIGSYGDNVASMAWKLHAIEQMQLRGRRCVDGVGRPKFDFHTGPRQIQLLGPRREPDVELWERPGRWRVLGQLDG